MALATLECLAGRPSDETAKENMNTAGEWNEKWRTRILIRNHISWKITAKIQKDGREKFLP